MEKHILEHKWREKHSVLHHGYSIVLYIFTVLVCLYIVVRLILCWKSKGTSWKVVSMLKFLSTTNVNPRSAGLGNVVNINIKPSNESLALAPEDVPLCNLPPSGNRDTDLETQTSQHPQSSHSYFKFRPIYRMKLVSLRGEVVHTCMQEPGGDLLEQGHLVITICFFYLYCKLLPCRTWTLPSRMTGCDW